MDTIEDIKAIRIKHTESNTTKDQRRKMYKESIEWWEYHLTESGWVDGAYKHDFEKATEVPAPEGTLLTRRYFESLAHPKASMNVGFNDVGGISQAAKTLLERYPHPERFKSYSFARQ